MQHFHIRFIITMFLVKKRLFSAKKYKKLVVKHIFGIVHI